MIKILAFLSCMNYGGYVKDLSSDRYKTRIEAERKLDTPLAIPALMEGSLSKDIQTADSCFRILNRHVPFISMRAQAIAILCMPGKWYLSGKIEDLIASQSDQWHLKACRELRSLGFEGIMSVEMWLIYNDVEYSDRQYRVSYWNTLRAKVRGYCRPNGCVDKKLIPENEK